MKQRFVIASALIALGFFMSCSQAENVTLPESVAHRGCWLKDGNEFYINENCPAGVKMAARYGYPAIECDVKYTLDSGKMPDESGAMLVVGDLKLDTKKFILYDHGKEVFLTPTEFKILSMFMERPGMVFTKSQIYERINGEFYENDDNTVSITCYPVISYGKIIPEVAWLIQEKVKGDVEKFTGLNVDTVDVYVCGVSDTESSGDVKGEQEE